MKRKGLIAILFSAVLAAALALTGCNSGEPYEPQSKSPEVTSPVIANNGTLRVGVNTGNPPLAGQSSSIVGIDVDIAAALADELGLKLEIVDVKSDAAAALKAGTIDVALGIDSATTKDSDMWLSDVYLQTSVALFATSQEAKIPTKDSKPKIGAQVSSLSAWTVSNEFGADSLKNETDLASAFNDLSNKEIDYVAADAIVGSYAAHSAGSKVFINALTQEPTGYAMAVSAKNTSLQTAIQTKLKALTTNGVISLIEKKWLGASLDLSKVPTTAGAKNNSASAQNEKKEAEESEKEEKAEEGESSTIASNAVR